MTVATRWFRAGPDSSQLSAPRLLSRLLIPLDDLDGLVEAYEAVLRTPADLRMPIPDFGGLELSAIGGVLLIASERPFTAVQRATRYSLIVPSLAGAIDESVGVGAEVVEPAEDILPGSRARLRYPDGSLAELVEHRPLPAEQPRRLTGRGGPPVGLLSLRRVSPAVHVGAVRFYEHVLRTPAVDVPDQVATATRIGTLLLVADDRAGGAPRPDEARVALCSDRRLTGDLPRHGVDEATRRPVVSLPGDLYAEVWPESVITCASSAMPES